jgi:hypothetical protein
MRLYDLLRTVDPSMPPCTNLIADEVATLIDSSDAAPDFACWPADWYGVVAPPWPSCFIEARTTSALAPGAPRYLVERGLFMEDLTRSGRIDRNEHLPPGSERPAGTHWILTFYGYARFERTDLYLFPGQLFLHLDRAGRILDDMRGVPMVEYPAHALIPGAQYLPLQLLPGFVPFALKAIGLLHERTPVEHVIPSRQQRRAAQRAGESLSEHYILRINTPVAQRRSAQLPPLANHAPIRREHQVRGHFRFYTDEKPLFGRIAGAVWIPQHTRGDTTLGSIEKGYALHMGGEDDAGTS